MIKHISLDVKVDIDSTIKAVKNKLVIKALELISEEELQQIMKEEMKNNIELSSPLKKRERGILVDVLSNGVDHKIEYHQMEGIVGDYFKLDKENLEKLEEMKKIFKEVHTYSEEILESGLNCAVCVSKK